MSQAEIDTANAEFWDELCGSTFARSLGISDHSLQSLQRFDDAYLDFYPYLLRHVPVATMRERRVLEVGLGYGTLGQKIAEAGAEYLGLDIAAGPVRMMNGRLRLLGLKGEAIQGNILASGLPSAAFDAVVAIGCFHHTGDVQRSFDETYRLLRPGGNAYLMVYNKFSLRQWSRWPMRTASAALRQTFGTLGARSGTEDERRAYDASAGDAAAPETAFLSKSDVKLALRKFASVRVTRENCDPLIWNGRQIVSRDTMMKTVGHSVGLDLYIAAAK